MPARFESLLPVVLTLVELARKAGTPLTRQLAEPKEWHRLWHAATTWNPEADTESACPYLGLTSYRQENRELFFGRAQATTELATLVRETTATSGGIVIVVGASGAGKSSLLAAGLTPALADRTAITFTPGATPLNALLTATDRSSGTTPSDAEPVSMLSTVTEALAPRTDTTPRLLIVDQFEELFTTCENDSEREDFLSILNTCATRADDPIPVVVALRADFYAHCLNHPILQDTLEHRSFLLGPMRLDELAQAISGPAKAAGLELETGLEELVVTELCGAGEHHDQRSYDPGALPLLSHVMAATWQHREGRRLTIAGYRKAGGVVGSVAETAEHAWNELSPAQQQAAQHLLLGLVVVSQDSRDTRRPAQRSELLRRASGTEDATAALELLSRTRLVTLDADAVILTHEIVLSAWPRLRGWIDEDRVGYLVRQRLEADSAEWAGQERDSSLLYHGTRLQNALDHRGSPSIGSLTHEFLTASAAARDRTRRRSSRTKAILALLGVVLLVLGIAAYGQVRLVQQQRADKTFTALVTQADRLRSVDPALAAQLYLVARQLRPGDAEIRTKLLQTQHVPLLTVIPAHENLITSVTFTPNGRLLASIGFEATLRLWDMADPRQPQALGAPITNVTEVLFRPDSAVMATLDETHQIRLWDISVPDTPRALSTIPGSDKGGRQAQAAFLGDGRSLAVLTDTDVMRWDISDPATPVRGGSWPMYDRPLTSEDLHGKMHETVRASPDGRLLAISRRLPGETVTVQLWDVTDPTAPVALTRAIHSPDGSLHGMVFSPDSRMLAVHNGGASITPTGPETAQVQLWDISDPADPRIVSPVLETGESSTGEVAFGPGGRTLAASGTGGVELWNIVEPGRPTRIGDPIPIGQTACRSARGATRCAIGPKSLVLSPDGKTLAGGSEDGGLLLWSLAPTVLDGHSGTQGPPQFDASGERMVTLSGEGRLFIWDLRNPQSPSRIGGYRVPSDFHSFFLAPDGNTLLLSTLTNEPATALDLTDPSRIRPIPAWEKLAPKSLNTNLVPSADWRMLAALDKEGAVQLWDISDRAHPTPVGASMPLGVEYGYPVFGPGNETLAVVRFMDDLSAVTLALWDIADPAQPHRISEEVSLPRSSDPEVLSMLDLYPDFRTALYSQGNTIASWDISDPAHPRRLSEPIVADTITVRLLDLSADQQTVVVHGGDGSVQLWDYSDPAHPARIGGPLIEPSTAFPQLVFHPDGRHLAATTSADAAIRLWDLDEQHAVDRICAITWNLWTPELWQRYLPELGYDPPCR